MDFHEISATGIALTDFRICKIAMDRASDPDADPIRNKVEPVDSMEFSLHSRRCWARCGHLTPKQSFRTFGNTNAYLERMVYPLCDYRPGLWAWA